MPDEFTAEFDRWYEDEHVPVLLEAGDWLRVRRYRVLDGTGGPWTHLALHELASTGVMDSPERARARKGPLRDVLAGNDWFARSGRWLYEQISVVVATGAGASMAAWSSSRGRAQSAPCSSSRWRGPASASPWSRRRRRSTTRPAQPPCTRPRWTCSGTSA